MAAVNFSSAFDHLKLSPALRYVSVVAIPLTFIQTIIGSGLIVFALASNKKLLNSSNFMVGILVVPDILMMLTACPVLFWTYLSGQWAFGVLGYKIYMYVVCTCFASSVAHQMCIALQKYVIIVHDSRVLISRGANAVCVILCWVLALSLLLPTIVDEIRGRVNVDVGLDCMYYPGLGVVQMWIYSAYTTIPCIVMAFCYGSIFRENRNVGKNIIQQQSGDAVLNRTKRVFRKRQMALARTTAVCSLVMLLGYAPFAFLRALDPNGNAHRAWYTAFTIFYCAATGSNALVYGLLHRTFRLAYKSALYSCFPCCKCLKTKRKMGDFRQSGSSSRSTRLRSTSRTDSGNATSSTSDASKDCLKKNLQASSTWTILESDDNLDK